MASRPHGTKKPEEKRERTAGNARRKRKSFAAEALQGIARKNNLGHHPKRRDLERLKKDSARNVFLMQQAQPACHPPNDDACSFLNFAIAQKHERMPEGYDAMFNLHSSATNGILLPP